MRPEQMKICACHVSAMFYPNNDNRSPIANNDRRIGLQCDEGEAICFDDGSRVRL